MSSAVLFPARLPSRLIISLRRRLPVPSPPTQTSRPHNSPTCLLTPTLRGIVSTHQIPVYEMADTKTQKVTIQSNDGVPIEIGKLRHNGLCFIILTIG